jgi:hypothetical protein
MVPSVTSNSISSTKDTIRLSPFVSPDSSTVDEQEMIWGNELKKRRLGSNITSIWLYAVNILTFLIAAGTIYVGGYMEQFANTSMTDSSRLPVGHIYLLYRLISENILM